VSALQGRNKRRKLEIESVGLSKNHIWVSEALMMDSRGSLASAQAGYYSPVVMDLRLESSVPKPKPAPEAANVAADVLYDSLACPKQEFVQKCDDTAAGAENRTYRPTGAMYATAQLERWSTMDTGLNSLQQLLEETLLAAGEGVGDNFDHVVGSTNVLSTTSASDAQLPQHSRRPGNPVVALVALAEETTAAACSKKKQPALHDQEDQCSGVAGDAWMLDEALIDACLAAVRMQCWQLQRSLARMQQLMDQSCCCI
jgi:hypothetical protein